MILFLFSQFALSFTFGNGVKDLTAKNWLAEIQQRSNTTVYFVMFHGQHCPACQMSYPAFAEAAKSSTTTIKFGEVDTSREYNIASQFNIRGIPTFIVFHPKGETVYNQDRSARSFLNTAYKYVPDLSETVNESWLTPNIVNRSIILFSDKKNVPPLWKAVSCHFQNTSIKIGFSDNQTIRSIFKISAVPTIYMTDSVNNTHYVYNGKNNFNDIRKAVVDFFHGKIKPPTPKPLPAIAINSVKNLEDFNKICKNKGIYCVIEGGKEVDVKSSTKKEENTEAEASPEDTNSASPSQEFKDIARKYRNDPFKFYTCENDDRCPLEFARKKGYWILHPKREAGINVEGIEELRASLDRVIGGDARFTPINKPTGDDL